ncbi:MULTISPECIES: acetyl-CoA acetyltransferase [unclassified Rhodococcus (in: high G+C Gram-positive bacteria)]|uniref:acetyl-CoA acetyltransferase n=1 Tax=unclassified Rhodococcus (in: high G+C Gram-positive bacteria) TaxID=192944 RepID=UPI0021BFCB20
MTATSHGERERGTVDHVHLDPSTPILVGCGQVSDPLDRDDYRRWSAVELAAEASKRALADAGLAASAVDTVAGIRQFEISSDFGTAPLGRSNNFPRSVANRLDASPQRAVLEVVGGQGPQHLVNEFAKEIAAGRVQTVLLFGSEAISTARAFAGKGDSPDFNESVEGDLEDRGYGLEGLMNEYEMRHGLVGAPSQYALLEHARRHRSGLSVEAYANQMGQLFAPFTSVAARNPFAAAPVERTADELAAVSEKNRLIADPYPRYMVARDQVNQGAAVVMTSVGAADAAGISEDRRVYLHGSCDLRELNLLDRPDMSRSPASVRASEIALQRAGVSVDDVAFFDLYSCFPIAVLNICDGLGLAVDDPRGLTLTGGLPFFGGAGNNYAMHAIAEAMNAVRSGTDGPAFVGANGGTLSKYSVGIYSTVPQSFCVTSDVATQAELDSVERIAVASLDGTTVAILETYTVEPQKSGGAVSIAVGRLGDGSRILAVSDDETIASTLRLGASIGSEFSARPSDGRNVLIEVGSAN